MAARRGTQDGLCSVVAGGGRTATPTGDRDPDFGLDPDSDRDPDRGPGHVKLAIKTWYGFSFPRAHLAAWRLVHASRPLQRQSGGGGRFRASGPKIARGHVDFS